MNHDNPARDPVFAAIAKLRPHDVGAHRADRLRSRCHGVLEQQRRRSVERRFARMSLRRAVVPAIASAWCAAYVCEILLRAAAIYGF
jgi:hypothetical protein